MVKIRLTMMSNVNNRGESRAAAISKMERFVIIVNGWKLLLLLLQTTPPWMLQQL